MAVGPTGTAHVIWNGGEGVRYLTSKDDGANWTVGSRIHDQGGSSHLAAGPRGALAVRITPRSASDILVLAAQGIRSQRIFDPRQG